MFTFNCSGRLLIIEKPLVMGIVNVTPDSFYEGSRVQSVDDAVAAAINMIALGATIIDVGGQSTRPGSTIISAAEEADRVLPVIEKLRTLHPNAFISIDTYYALVAKQSVLAGAHMVNDVSGGSLDTEMLATVGACNVPYVCMHMQGTPQTMQQKPQYKNVVLEVIDFFIKRIEDCRLAGISDVIIDVGFGFGKTTEHNFSLLDNLSHFKLLQRPILAGVSRKGMVYKTLGVTANEALNGTTVLNTIALQNGANILRVHDVKEALEAIKLVDKLQNGPLKF